MIPFVDLKTQYAAHRQALDAAMAQVCETGGYILGPAVQRFEASFAAYLGVSDAIGVGTGTDALRISCEVLGIGAGDEVLVPANTFIASALGVQLAGGTPIPCDIDTETYLIDLEDAGRRVTSRTKAIMPVHLYGRATDMDALEAFARTHNLMIIEDACQAHGARWAGRRIGSFGKAACFSFYPSKNLGALGDGGMAVTNDPAVAENIRLARNYGSTRKYVHESLGGNSRLDGLQAAVLEVKLGMLDAWNANRFRAACAYSDRLAAIPQLAVPAFDRDRPEGHVFHLYVVRCRQRDALADHLGERGIQTGIHYPIPYHLQKAFAHLGLGAGTCPRAEAVASEILSLPMFPEISEGQVDEVCDGIASFFAGK